MKKIKKRDLRVWTQKDEEAMDALAQRAKDNEQSVFKALEMINTLREDRRWLVEEVQRLRGILDAAGVEYEKRLLRTPEQVEKDSARFAH